MSEWKEVQLGDLIEIKYGKDHKKLNKGNIPCFGSGGIMRYVDEQLYDKESILIPRKGSLNNILFQNSPFWTVDTMFWSKIDIQKAYPKFLYYQLTLIDYTVLNVGSAVPSLTVPVINTILINLPSLSEQKEIAEVLSSLDDKIDLLNRQNKTLEQMAETLFRQWFVEEAQDAWEEGVLGDIIDFNPVYHISKGENVPYLEMKNLNNTSFNPKNWYYRNYTSGMKFQNEDTIMARITPCLENGKTAFIYFLEKNKTGWGSTEYIVMRMKDPFNKFISYIMARDKDFTAFAITNMSGSSGRQRVQVNTLKDYGITIPSIAVIKKLNEHLDPIVEKLKYNARQIPILENMRDTLLPKLMNGEISVKN